MIQHEYHLYWCRQLLSGGSDRIGITCAKCNCLKLEGFVGVMLTFEVNTCKFKKLTFCTSSVLLGEQHWSDSVALYTWSEGCDAWY